MKKILLTAAVAVLAGPAFAQSTQGVQTETWTINGDNPAKCQISTSSNTVDLPADSISNDQGRARGNLGQRIAAGLNGTNPRAWCTGARNSVVLTRTPLTTGDGAVNNGFNQAVIYDIAVDVQDAERVDGFRPIEATSDGPGNGPGVGVGASTPVGNFGPTGAGSRLDFSNETGSTSEATTNGTGDGDRSNYPGNNARLTAGTYSGQVVLTITPGN